MEFWCLIKNNLEWMGFFRFFSFSIAGYTPWEAYKGEVKNEAETLIGRER
jgi:hypothetical protein